MTQPADAQPANRRSSLSAGEKAAGPRRRMNVLSRQWHPVQLNVPASSVANVVAAISDSQEQEDRRLSLVLKVCDDGRLRARIPSTTRHITPSLTGQLEPDGDSVMLRGVIREPAGAVLVLWVYLTMAILLLLLAIVQVAHPVPGAVVCGSCGVLLGLTGYWLARSRTDGFCRDCAKLIEEVTSVLPTGHRHVTLSPRALAALTEAERVLTWISRFGRGGNRLP
jgi:hypothetical protein